MMQNCNSPVLPSLQNVSRETLHKINSYVTQLQKWQKSINLVSKDTQDIWGRHIEDSAQLAKFIPQSEPLTIIDIGSGGGLPGIVLALIFPQHQFFLVESDKRKTIFLSEIVRTLEMRNASIIHQRIEEWDGKGDIVMGRALAALEDLLAYAEPKLKQKESFCLFPKGQNWDMEVSKAKMAWNFQYQTHPSTTLQEAVILKIQQLIRITR